MAKLKKFHSKPASPPLNGFRRAELIAKQILRWQERKWPLATHPAEWLKFGAALRVAAELIESDARRIVNPAAFAKSKADLLRERQAAKEIQNEEETEK